MSILTKYYTGNLEKFLNDIDKYTIGMDDWIKRNKIGAQNIDYQYPLYNTIKENETNFIVEIALAGFKRKNLSVYTENGKLFVLGKTNKNESDTREYINHGITTKEFTRVWSLPDNLEVKDISFEDGLLSIKLVKILPESQKRKVLF
jgi:molecular chaperone IbpA